MSENIIYDKVSWHFPEGKNCASLTDAKKHLEVVMEWASNKKFLSPEGVEIFELGVNSDFSITSSMLNAEGISFFDGYYSEFVANTSYGEEKKVVLSRLERIYSSL